MTPSDHRWDLDANARPYTRKESIDAFAEKFLVGE